MIHVLKWKPIRFTEQKLQYINQDEYFGSKYFLNKVGSSTDAGRNWR